MSREPAKGKGDADASAGAEACDIHIAMLGSRLTQVLQASVGPIDTAMALGLATGAALLKVRQEFGIADLGEFMHHYTLALEACTRRLGLRIAVATQVIAAEAPQGGV